MLENNERRCTESSHRGSEDPALSTSSSSPSCAEKSMVSVNMKKRTPSFSDGSCTNLSPPSSASASSASPRFQHKNIKPKRAVCPLSSVEPSSLSSAIHVATTPSLRACCPPPHFSVAAAEKSIEEQCSATFPSLHPSVVSKESSSLFTHSFAGTSTIQPLTGTDFKGAESGAQTLSSSFFQSLSSDLPPPPGTSRLYCPADTSLEEGKGWDTPATNQSSAFASSTADDGKPYHRPSFRHHHHSSLSSHPGIGLSSDGICSYLSTLQRVYKSSKRHLPTQRVTFEAAWSYLQDLLPTQVKHRERCEKEIGASAPLLSSSSFNRHHETNVNSVCHEGKNVKRSKGSVDSSSVIVVEQVEWTSLMALSVIGTVGVFGFPISTVPIVKDAIQFLLHASPLSSSSSPTSGDKVGNAISALREGKERQRRDAEHTKKKECTTDNKKEEGDMEVNCAEQRGQQKSQEVQEGYDDMPEALQWAQLTLLVQRLIQKEKNNRMLASQLYLTHDEDEVEQQLGDRHHSNKKSSISVSPSGTSASSVSAEGGHIECGGSSSILSSSASFSSSGKKSLFFSSSLPPSNGLSVPSPLTKDSRESPSFPTAKASEKRGEEGASRFPSWHASFEEDAALHKERPLLLFCHAPSSGSSNVGGTTSTCGHRSPIKDAPFGEEESLLLELYVTVLLPRMMHQLRRLLRQPTPPPSAVLSSFSTVSLLSNEERENALPIIDEKNRVPGEAHKEKSGKAIPSWNRLELEVFSSTLSVLQKAVVQHLVAPFSLPHVRQFLSAENKKRNIRRSNEKNEGEGEKDEDYEKSTEKSRKEECIVFCAPPLLSSPDALVRHRQQGDASFISSTLVKIPLADFIYGMQRCIVAVRSLFSSSLERGPGDALADTSLKKMSNRETPSSPPALHNEAIHDANHLPINTDEAYMQNEKERSKTDDTTMHRTLSSSHRTAKERSSLRRFTSRRGGDQRETQNTISPLSRPLTPTSAPSPIPASLTGAPNVNHDILQPILLFSTHSSALDLFFSKKSKLWHSDIPSFSSDPSSAAAPHVSQFSMASTKTPFGCSSSSSFPRKEKKDIENQEIFLCWTELERCIFTLLRWSSECIPLMRTRHLAALATTCARMVHHAVDDDGAMLRYHSPPPLLLSTAIAHTTTESTARPSFSHTSSTFASCASPSSASETTKSEESLFPWKEGTSSHALPSSSASRTTSCPQKAPHFLFSSAWFTKRLALSLLLGHPFAIFTDESTFPFSMHVKENEDVLWVRHALLTIFSSLCHRAIEVKRYFSSSDIAAFLKGLSGFACSWRWRRAMLQKHQYCPAPLRGEEEDPFLSLHPEGQCSRHAEDGDIEVLVQDTITSVVSQLEWVGYKSSCAIGLILVYHSQEKMFLTISKRIPRYIAKAAGHSSSASQSTLTIAEYCTIQASLEKLTPVLPDVWLHVLGRLLHDVYFRRQPSDVVQYVLRSMYRHSMHSFHFGPPEGSNTALERTIENYFPYLCMHGRSDRSLLLSASPLSLCSESKEKIPTTTTTASFKLHAIPLSPNPMGHAFLSSSFSPLDSPVGRADELCHPTDNMDAACKNEDADGSWKNIGDVMHEEREQDGKEMDARSRAHHIFQCLCYLLSQHTIHASPTHAFPSSSPDVSNNDEKKKEEEKEDEERITDGPSSALFWGGNEHRRGPSFSASPTSLSSLFCGIPSDVLENFLHDHLDEHKETYQTLVRDASVYLPSHLSLKKDIRTIDEMGKGFPKTLHDVGENERWSMRKPQEEREEVHQLVSDDEKETKEAGAVQQHEAHVLASLAKVVELLVLSVRFAPETTHKKHSHREKLIFHACGFFLEYFCFFSSFPVSTPRNGKQHTRTDAHTGMLQKPILWRNHSPLLHRVLLSLTLLSRWSLLEGMRSRQAEVVTDGAGVEGRADLLSWSSVRPSASWMQSKRAKELEWNEKKKVEERKELATAPHAALLEDHVPFREVHFPFSFSTRSRSTSTAMKPTTSSMATSLLVPFPTRTRQGISPFCPDDHLDGHALMCRVLTHLLSLFHCSERVDGSGAPCSTREEKGMTEEEKECASMDGLFFCTLANVSHQVSRMEVEMCSSVGRLTALTADANTLSEQWKAHMKKDARKGVDSNVLETDVEGKDSVVRAAVLTSPSPVSLSSTSTFPLPFTRDPSKSGLLHHLHLPHGHHGEYSWMFLNDIFFDTTVREALSTLVSRALPVRSNVTTMERKKNTSSEFSPSRVPGEECKVRREQLLLSRSVPSSFSSSSSSYPFPFLFHLAHFFSVPVSYSLLENSAQQSLCRWCSIPVWFVDLLCRSEERKEREVEDVRLTGEGHDIRSPWRRSGEGEKMCPSWVGRDEEKKVGINLLSEIQGDENPLQTRDAHELRTSAFSATLRSPSFSTLSSLPCVLHPSECSAFFPSLLQWALLPWTSGIRHYTPPSWPSSFFSDSLSETTATSSPADPTVCASLGEKERTRKETAEVLDEKVKNPMRQANTEEDDRQWLEGTEGWTTKSPSSSKGSWIRDTRLPDSSLFYENDAFTKECCTYAAGSDFQSGKNEGNLPLCRNTTRKSVNSRNCFWYRAPFSSSTLESVHSSIGLCADASEQHRRMGRSDPTASTMAIEDDDRCTMSAGNSDNITDTPTAKKVHLYFPASLSCLSHLLKSWAVAFTLSTSLFVAPSTTDQKSRASSDGRDDSDKEAYLLKRKRSAALNALCGILLKQRRIPSSSVYYELVHSFRCCLFDSGGFGVRSGTTPSVLDSSFPFLQRNASVVEEEDLIVFFGSLLEILALVRQQPPTIYYACKKTCEEETVGMDKTMAKEMEHQSLPTATTATPQISLDNRREEKMDFRSTFLCALEEIIWECGESLREFQDRAGAKFCDGRTVFCSSSLKRLGYLLAGIAALPISSVDSSTSNSFGAPSHSCRRNSTTKDVSGACESRWRSGAEQCLHDFGSHQSVAHTPLASNEHSSLLSTSYFLHLLVRPFLQAMVFAVETKCQSRHERNVSFSSSAPSPLSDGVGRVVVGIPPTSLLQYLAMLDASLLSLLLRTQTEGNHRHFGQSMKYPRLVSSTSLKKSNEKGKGNNLDGLFQTGAFDGEGYLIATPLDCFLHVLLHLRIAETDSAAKMSIHEDEEEEEEGSSDEESLGNKTATSFPCFFPSHPKTCGLEDDHFHHEKENDTSSHSSLAFIPPLLGKKLRKQLSRQVAQGVWRLQQVTQSGEVKDGKKNGRREKSSAIEEENLEWRTSSVHERTDATLLPSTSSIQRHRQELFQKERLFRCLTKLILQPQDFSNATPATVGRLSFVLDSPQLSQKNKNVRFRILQLLFHCVLKKGIDIVGTNLAVRPPPSCTVPSSFQRVVYLSPTETTDSYFPSLHATDSPNPHVLSSPPSPPSCTSSSLRAPPFVMACLPFISLDTWCELLQGPRPLSLFWFAAFRKEWISDDRSYLRKGGRRHDHAPGPRGRGGWVGGEGAALSLSPCEDDFCSSTTRQDVPLRHTTSLTNAGKGAVPRKVSSSASFSRRSRSFLPLMDTTVNRNIKFHHSGFLFLTFLELSHLEEMRVVLGPLSLLRLCNHVLMYYVERWVGCAAEEGVASYDEQRVMEKRAVEILMRSWCGSGPDHPLLGSFFSAVRTPNGKGQENDSRSHGWSCPSSSSPSGKVEEKENPESSRTRDEVENIEQKNINFFAPSWMIYASHDKTRRECPKRENKKSEEKRGNSASTIFSFPFRAHAQKTRLRGINLWYAYAHHLLCSMVFDNDGNPLTPEKRCDIIYRIAQEEHHARCTFHQRRQSLLEFTASPQDNFRVSFQGERQGKNSSSTSFLSSSSSVILDVSLLLDTMKLLETMFYDGSAVMEEAGVFHLEAEVLEWGGLPSLLQVKSKRNSEEHVVSDARQIGMQQEMALNTERTKAIHKNSDVLHDGTCVKECSTTMAADSHIRSWNDANVEENNWMSFSTSFLLSLFRIGSDLRQKPSFASPISVVVTNSSSVLSYWSECIRTMQRRADDFTESIDELFSGEIHSVEEKEGDEMQCLRTAVVSPATLLVIGQRLQQVVEDTLQDTILQVPCEGIGGSGDVTTRSSDKKAHTSALLPNYRMSSYEVALRSSLNAFHISDVVTVFALVVKKFLNTGFTADRELLLPLGDVSNNFKHMHSGEGGLHSCHSIAKKSGHESVLHLPFALAAMTNMMEEYLSFMSADDVIRSTCFVLNLYQKKEIPSVLGKVVKERKEKRKVEAVILSVTSGEKTSLMSSPQWKNVEAKHHNMHGRYLNELSGLPEMKQEVHRFLCAVPVVCANDVERFQTVELIFLFTSLFIPFGISAYTEKNSPPFATSDETNFNQNDRNNQNINGESLMNSSTTLLSRSEENPSIHFIRMVKQHSLVSGETARLVADRLIVSYGLEHTNWYHTFERYRQILPYIRKEKYSLFFRQKLSTKKGGYSEKEEVEIEIGEEDQKILDELKYFGLDSYFGRLDALYNNYLYDFSPSLMRFSSSLLCRAFPIEISPPCSYEVGMLRRNTQTTCRNEERSQFYLFLCFLSFIEVMNQD